MIRRFLIRHLPSREAVHQQRSLGPLQKWMQHHSIWQFNRRSISKAMAIGLFWALIPMPFQMIPAAICAVFLRANIPLALALVWLTNPITMPPIMYACYKFGAWLLDSPAMALPSEFTSSEIANFIAANWQPLYLGSFVLACIFAVLGYALTLLYWRWWVSRAWRKRQIASAP